MMLGLSTAAAASAHPHSRLHIAQPPAPAGPPDSSYGAAALLEHVGAPGSYMADLYERMMAPGGAVQRLHQSHQHQQLYPDKSALSFARSNKKFDWPISSSVANVGNDNKCTRSSSSSSSRHSPDNRPTPIHRSSRHPLKFASSSLDVASTRNDDRAGLGLGMGMSQGLSLGLGVQPNSFSTSCYLADSCDYELTATNLNNTTTTSGSSRVSNQSQRVNNVASTRTRPCLARLPPTGVGVSGSQSDQYGDRVASNNNYYTTTTTISSSSQLGGASHLSTLPVSCHRRRYKTEMCRRFLSSPQHYCDYGDKCQYAHGVNELRMPSRHLKYKTELCKPFHSTGICPYGRRCDFIHNESKKKLVEIRSLLQMFHQFRTLYPSVEDVSICRMKQMMDQAFVSDPVAAAADVTASAPTNNSVTTATSSPLTSLLSNSSHNEPATPLSIQGGELQ